MFCGCAITRFTGPERFCRLPQFDNVTQQCVSLQRAVKDSDELVVRLRKVSGLCIVFVFPSLSVMLLGC